MSSLAEFLADAETLTAKINAERNKREATKSKIMLIAAAIIVPAVAIFIGYHLIANHLQWNAILEGAWREGRVTSIENGTARLQAAAPDKAWRTVFRFDATANGGKFSGCMKNTYFFHYEAALANYRQPEGYATICIPRDKEHLFRR